MKMTKERRWVRKTEPAKRVSGKGSKGFHLLGKIMILCWCAFTVAIIGWVIAASFTQTKDIFQNKLLSVGLNFKGYEIVMERYHIMDYFFNSVLYTCLLYTSGGGADAQRAGGDGAVLEPKPDDP